MHIEGNIYHFDYFIDFQLVQTTVLAWLPMQLQFVRPISNRGNVANNRFGRCFVEHGVLSEAGVGAAIFVTLSQIK